MPALSFVPNWQSTALASGNSQLGGLYRGAKQSATDDMSRFNGTMGGAQSGLLSGLTKHFAQQGAQLGRDVGTKAGDWMFQGGQNDLNRAQDMEQFNKKMAYDEKWSKMSLEQRQAEMERMSQLQQQKLPWDMFGSFIGGAGAALGGL